MTKSNRFFIAIAFQVLIICAIAIFKLSVASGGTEVLVRIQPVDPRDPLRGDYVTFQYDISSVYGSYNTMYTRGQTVYVPLRKSGKYWVADYVRSEAPTDDSLYLKATVKADSSRDQKVSVTYGAEEYFIPEGLARISASGIKSQRQCLLSMHTVILFSSVSMLRVSNGHSLQVRLNKKPYSGVFCLAYT